MRNVYILGVKISNITKKSVTKTITQSLHNDGKLFITTPNPEIILKAQDDEEFYTLLNKADISLADGFGVKLACFTYGKNIKRITGADIVFDFLNIAQKNKKSVGIVNWKNSLSTAEEIKKSVHLKYPALDITVYNAKRDLKKYSKQLIDKIGNNDIVFSTFGAPFQEKFLFYNKKKLKKTKVLIGVGGAFDFLTGKIKRAPKVFRYIGLEWLWRLIQQPKRINRIYNAVIVFYIKFLKWRLVNRFIYRPNVSCILYKIQNNGNIKILLVNRNEEEDHWQLPQGGKDGMSTEDTGKKELNEEIGTSKFKTTVIFKKLHKYKYGARNGRSVNRGQRIFKRRGYKGQKQDLYVAKYTGNSNDIKVNFWEHKDWKWVDINKVLLIVHPIRKTGTKIFLKKFNTIDNSLL